jgi:hypothetical protein
MDEEAAAHFVQLVTVGALRAEHTEPVRDILQAIFEGKGQHVSRTLDGKPRPNLVDSPRQRLAELRQRLNELAGKPRSRMASLVDPGRAALADLDQRRAEHVAWQLRDAADRADRWWKETAFMREGDGNPRYRGDPPWDEDAKMIAETLLDCKS